jgi:hypothetical protein
LVESFDSVEEMNCIFFANVLDSTIVNNQRELDRTVMVLPKAGCMASCLRAANCLSPIVANEAAEIGFNKALVSSLAAIMVVLVEDSGSDNNKEQANNALEGDTDGPKQRKRGNQRGKTKLFDIAKVVMKKEVQLFECLQVLDPTEYHERQSTLLLLLNCKKKNLKEKLADKKVSLMIEKFDRDKESSLERIRGKDVPPHLLGYFPYALVLQVVNLAKLAKELAPRRVAFDPGDDIQKCGLTLRKNESERFETWIENELAQRGKSFVTLSLSEKNTRLKQTLFQEKECDCGELEVDVGMFFKKMSDIDEKIFDE